MMVSRNTACLKKKLLFLLLASSRVLADSASIERLQLTGSAVTNHLILASADGMASLTSSPSTLLFVDMMGNYASNLSYLLSPGLGLRTLFNNNIFGVYFFGDYEQTNLGANFWNLSPGIEWISPFWDAHLNVYFPTQHRKVIGVSEYAHRVGYEQAISFIPGTHNQYDSLLQPYAVIGKGGDIELGYSFDQKANSFRSRIYFGSYYYQAPHPRAEFARLQNNIGITTGISQALSKNWKLNWFASSDQINKYQLGMSISLTFGGESNRISTNVHSRIFDSIERHIGIIGTGAGNYDQKYWQPAGQGLVYNNVYFLSPMGKGDGTYGKPMPLTQSSLDSIHTQNPSSARLYLQGGRKAVYNINAASATRGGGLYLYGGEQIYGRSLDYQSKANSSSQPQIQVDGLHSYNGFIIQAGKTSLSDLKIYSSTKGYGTGIIANHTTQNTQILSLNNTIISQFTTAVFVNNSNRGSFILNTNNVHFDKNSQTGSGAAAYGMNLLNTGTGKLIMKSRATSFNNNSTSGDSNQTTGLSLYNASSGSIEATLINSSFNNNRATGDNAPIAAGLYALNQGSGLMLIKVSNSQFNANFASNQAFGYEAINFGSGTLSFTADQAQFNNNSAGFLSAGIGGGNYSSGSLTISAYQSLFIPGWSTNSYRVFTYEGGTGPIKVSIG